MQEITIQSFATREDYIKNPIQREGITYTKFENPVVVIVYDFDGTEYELVIQGTFVIFTDS